MNSARIKRVLQGKALKKRIKNKNKYAKKSEKNTKKTQKNRNKRENAPKKRDSARALCPCLTEPRVSGLCKIPWGTHGQGVSAVRFERKTSAARYFFLLPKRQHPLALFDWLLGSGGLANRLANDMTTLNRRTRQAHNIEARWTLEFASAAKAASNHLGLWRGTLASTKPQAHSTCQSSLGQRAPLDCTDSVIMNILTGTKSTPS